MGTLKSKGEIERLYHFLPILEGILPQADATRKDVKLSTKIRVADKETLFIIPEFAVGHMITKTADNRYAGHINTSAYALDANKNIIKKVVWTNANPFEFLKSAITNDGKTEMLLLFLEIQLHHRIQNAEEKNLKSELGDFFRNEYELYIYKPPKCGYKDLVANADLSRNVIIDPKSIIKLSIAAARGQKDAKEYSDKIDKIIDKFVKEKGSDIYEYLDTKKLNHLTGLFNNTVLFVNCGSRIILRFISGSSQVVLTGFSSDYESIGLQEMNCSVQRVESMINDVVANWSRSLSINEETN